ncbi:MAG: DUF1289 domain-containing protein [Planctomycetota bacterium]
MATQSPCIKLCRLDSSGSVCVGCYRTTEEIIRWSSFDEERRRAVIASAVARQRAAEGERTGAITNRWSRPLRW